MSLTDKLSSTWRPNIMVPRQKEETLSPVLPIFLYSMSSSFVLAFFNAQRNHLMSRFTLPDLVSQELALALSQ